LAWYDNMQNSVPTWYLRNFYIQYIDGLPYKLKSPFDMSFISNYGKVFKVFDDQDSGNICFGVQNESGRHFIKYAGAPTEQYDGTAEDAIRRLKKSIPVYTDLAHGSLIKLIKAEETEKGYVAAFDWYDAECMARMYPLSRKKFMSMSLKTKIKVFEDVLNFHVYAAEKGYVAIDFYDGSIMYDFKREKTIICDIDFYTKQPYINDVGRMWGSKNFMSPEEFNLGALIDEITNVYTMGATAFALFSNYDRSIDKWPLSKELHRVVKKAVSENRQDRQQSINQLIEEWRNIYDL